MSGSNSSATFFHRALRAMCWTGAILLFCYIAIVIYAYPHDHEEHIAEAMVRTINSKKISAGDADGSKLPPPPDPVQANATIAGIDANDNGIRDDVELAIFAEYPASSATSTAVRGAELQYAMDLQTLLTDVFDSTTWQAAMVQRERGFGCLYDSTNGHPTPLETEVDDRMLNTLMRVEQFQLLDQYSALYTLSSGPDCDVTRN
jgi:hypothetical protein